MTPPPVPPTRRIPWRFRPRSTVRPATAPIDLPGDVDVLRALVRRRDTGSRDDGARIALVVGGGGMRGAYSGGMAFALEDAGLGPGFDVVYGSSAGAYVGAAILLGDGRGSAHIFFEDMASPAFIDVRRLRTRRPMVSLDHLLDGIMVASKPMPWERLRDLSTPLRVVATAADDLTGHVLEPATVDEWKLALRATSTIPLLAGRPVALHGRRWIDGSVAEPLPVLRALEDGATHVLVLVNRTVTELRRADAAAKPSRWAGALDRVAPGLGVMAQESRRLGPVVDLLADADHPSRRGVRVLPLAPAVDAGVRGLTTDPVRVEAAARIGYDTVVAALAACGDRIGAP